MVSERMTKTIFAGLALCLVMAQAARADSAANGHVTVTCDAPGVSVTVNGNQFDIFAPTYPDSFVTNVMVAPHSGWTLVKPTASQLPLRMKGGSTAGYEVKRDPEDKGSGTIAFHNYYIKSNHDNGAKDITVVAGASVTYTARKNNADCRSNWTVQGPSITETKNNESRIIFNRSWWQIPDWFIPSINTPKPGVYTIDARDVDHAILNDCGEMVVFGADFGENGSHDYGFDDYTGWKSYDSSKATDYYGPKNGRCMWPYASVRENHDGLSTLDVLSFGASRTFDIASDTTRMTYSPATTAGSTPVQFNVDVEWYNLTGEATLSAKYEGAELAQLRVVPFKLQTRNVLIVSVNGATCSAVNLSTVNTIYKQCVTEFTQLGSGESFTYTNPPVNNVWTRNDRTALRTAVQNDPNLTIKVENANHVVFIIPGTDSKGSVLAWGTRSEKYVWIYSYVTFSSTLAHEFGHNCGLGDEYTFVSGGNSTPGDDLDNVMNMAGVGTGVRFRYPQWKTINKE